MTQAVWDDNLEGQPDLPGDALAEASFLDSPAAREVPLPDVPEDKIGIGGAFGIQASDLERSSGGFQARPTLQALLHRLVDCPPDSRKYLPKLLIALAQESEDNPDEWESRCKWMRISEGQTFITQDEPNGAIYIITGGNPAATIAVSIDGKRKHELPAPAIMGEMAIVNQGCATASVSVEGGEVEAIRIPYPLVEPVLRNRCLFLAEFKGFVCKQKEELQEERRRDKEAALRAEERFFLRPNPVPVPGDRDLQKLNERDTPLPFVRGFMADFGFSLRGGMLAGLMSQIAFELIAQEVAKTRQFIENPEERRRRTTMFVSVITDHGPDSALGRLMIARVNRSHTQLGITAHQYPEEFEHVIYTLVHYPLEFNKKYGHRSLNERETQAWYSLWRRTGMLMGIQSLPEDIGTFLERGREREKQQLERQKTSELNESQAVACSVVDGAAAHAPSFTRPFARQMLHSIPREVAEALHFPDTHLRKIVALVLYARQALLRACLSYLPKSWQAFARAFPTSSMYEEPRAQMTDGEKMDATLELITRARREMRHLALNYGSLRKGTPLQAIGLDGATCTLTDTAECSRFIEAYVLGALDRLPPGFRLERKIRDVGEALQDETVADLIADVRRRLEPEHKRTRSTVPGRPDRWISFFDRLAHAIPNNISLFSTV
jgi:hypothetical protein